MCFHVKWRNSIGEKNVMRLISTRKTQRKATQIKQNYTKPKQSQKLSKVTQRGWFDIWCFFSFVSALVCQRVFLALIDQIQIDCLKFDSGRIFSPIERPSVCMHAYT